MGEQPAPGGPGHARGHIDALKRIDFKPDAHLVGLAEGQFTLPIERQAPAAISG